MVAVDGLDLVVALQTVMVTVDDLDEVVALQLVMGVELSVLVVLLLELVALRDGAVVVVSCWAYSEELGSCGRVRFWVENEDCKEGSRGSCSHRSV